jgi:exonuclease SbcC
VALERAESALKEYDGEKLARARQEADATRTALRELSDHLREFDSVSRQASTAEAELKELKIASESDAKAFAELREKQIPEATKAAEAARRSFDLAEAAVADEAIRLREKLVPGEPCPVCGAKEHPHTSHPPALEAVALRALRADCVAREKAVRELEEAAARLDATRNTRLKQEELKEKTLATLRERLMVLRDFRHAHPAAAAILALPPESQAETLAGQLAEQQRALDAAEKAETARRAAEKLRQNCQAQRDLAATALVTHEKRVAELQQKLAVLHTARQSAESAQAEAENTAQAELVELTPLFDGLPNARAKWERDPAGFRTSFAEQTASLLALEVRLAELRGRIRESEVALGPAKEAVTRGEAEANAKRAEETKARSECEAIRVERSKIFEGRPADDVERELAEALRVASENRERQASDLEKASQRRAATVEKRKGAEQAQAESVARVTTAVAALDTWIVNFEQRSGSACDRAALETMLARDDQWIQCERAALDAMEGAVSKAEGVLTARQQAVESHSAARPTTDDEPVVTADLASLKTAQMEAEKNRDLARTAVHADDQRLRDNAALAAQLRERQVLADPWAKLNELIGSADGARFRGIAQRRTLDILLGYANAQLDQLTTRYRLERIPESLNLVVVDRDMGDERRSVHSLSGGESFLVSLALALALASLTSNRLRIESLFIDEGFGSLDPDTLGTAMNALMHLEAQGRKVGVISHVTEMTDAIPVQIKIVKGRSGASRLIVPGAPIVVEEPVAAEIGEKPSDAAVAEIERKILEILRREHAAGDGKVSTRALRDEIGCSKEEFTAARARLDGQVIADGRSLVLLVSGETR